MNRSSLIIDLKFNWTWSIGFHVYRIKYERRVNALGSQFSNCGDSNMWFSRCSQRERMRKFVEFSHWATFPCAFHSLAQYKFPSFIYIFTTHVFLHTQQKEKRRQFSEYCEKENQKNIFQMTASVVVCVYTTLDAFFLSSA